MFYSSKIFTKHGFKAVFSDREGGCSLPPFDGLNLGLGLGDLDKNVQTNLFSLCEASHMPMPHQTLQVHGVVSLICEGEGFMHDESADILIANKPNVALAVRTADCLPILMADYENKIIAAVHAGWKGSVAKVVQVGLKRMLEQGANAESVIVSMGPCIRACCFQVQADVAKAINDSCDGDVARQTGEFWFADLVEANKRQLLSLGVSLQHIETSNACTSCNLTPGYFSFRRDCGKTGRQLALISLS